MRFDLDEALASVQSLTEQIQRERSERQAERDTYEQRIAELEKAPPQVVERVRVEQVPVVEYRDKVVTVEKPVIEYRDRIVEKTIEVRTPPKVVTIEKPVEVIRHIDRPVPVEVYKDKELKKRYDALCQEFNALQERLNASRD